MSSLPNLLSVAVPIFPFLFKRFEDQWLTFQYPMRVLNLLLRFLGRPDHLFKAGAYLTIQNDLSCL